MGGSGGRLQGDLVTEGFEFADVVALLAVRVGAGVVVAGAEVVELGGRKFLVQHIVHPPAPDDKLKSRLARVRPDVVVFGHTHKPYAETLGGILFFNPGYSGKPKFGTERSVAIFHCDEKEMRHEFIPL